MELNFQHTYLKKIIKTLNWYEEITTKYIAKYGNMLNATNVARMIKWLMNVNTWLANKKPMLQCF